MPELEFNLDSPPFIEEDVIGDEQVGGEAEQKASDPPMWQLL